MAFVFYAFVFMLAGGRRIGVVSTKPENQARAGAGARRLIRKTLNVAHMYYSKCLRRGTALLLTLAICLPSLAQDKDKKKNEDKAGNPSETDMMAMMMELAKPGENHKLLTRGVGNWTYTVTMWMSPDPNVPPTKSTGTSVTKSVLDGRYFISEHTGKMQMPGPDGKMMDMEFKGMATDGYDNVKKKFVSSWIDNMGTCIVLSEGTYDAATRTFTYLSETEMMPGMKTKMRMVIKIVDQDHHTLEAYEDRGGTEAKTMEIKYARSGSSR